MPELANKAVVQWGDRLEEVAESASRFKSSISEGVEDNLHRVRRAAKRGLYGAQDLVGDAVYKVKRHPLEAVAIAAGTGFAIGLLVGWTTTRN